VPVNVALAQINSTVGDLVGKRARIVGHPHQLGSARDLRSKSMAVQLRFNAAPVLSESRFVATVSTYCKGELPNESARVSGLRRALFA
jgi:hypothetical protein